MAHRTPLSGVCLKSLTGPVDLLALAIVTRAAALRALNKTSIVKGDTAIEKMQCVE